jgi:hypothetical protein
MYQAFLCGLSRPLAGMEIRGPGAVHAGELDALWMALLFQTRI